MIKDARLRAKDRQRRATPYLADPTPPRVLLVGQLPPPVHGQAVANEMLFQGTYHRIELRTCPMRFSRTVEEVGSLGIRKVGLLVSTVWQALRLTRGGHRDVLVYSVGLKSTGAAIRDAVLLTFLRGRFRHVVFHVHTGDPGAVIDAAPAVLRPALRWVYGRADAVIYPDVNANPNGKGLPLPKSVAYIPCGAEDPEPSGPIERAGQPPHVLFMSNLYVSKGTHLAVEAMAEVNRRRRIAGATPVTLTMAGAPPDHATLKDLEELAERCGLGALVDFPGAVYGEAKAALFRRATAFCFPTFYEAESFGIVTIEAMAYGLPVVASTWRALPSIVEDGVSGLLVPPQDVSALADALCRVLDDETLARRMGNAGRERFEQRFTAETFRHAFEDVVVASCTSDRTMSD